MSTRESEAQVCVQMLPLSALSMKASQTSAGLANTAGHLPDANSHSPMAHAAEMSTHTQLGILLQNPFFFCLTECLQSLSAKVARPAPDFARMRPKPFARESSLRLLARPWVPSAAGGPSVAARGLFRVPTNIGK